MMKKRYHALYKICMQPLEDLCCGTIVRVFYTELLELISISDIEVLGES